MRQTSSLRVLQAPQLGWHGVIINIGNKNGAGNLPYANVGTPLASSAKLRQAFEEAIDRNALNRVVFGGLVPAELHADLAGEHRLVRRDQGSLHAVRPRAREELVAASGFPNPTVHLLTANATDASGCAQFIQAQEAAVGINVVIDPADSATAGARRRAGTSTRLGGLGPGGPTPHEHDRSSSSRPAGAGTTAATRTRAWT